MSDKEEYESFLRHLFNQYVGRGIIHRRGKLVDHPGYWHGSRLLKNIYYVRRQIKSVTALSDNHSDLDDVFQPDFLAETVGRAGRNVKRTSELLDDTGYGDALDNHLPEILSGLTVESLPPEERGVLRALGSDDPETDLQAMVYMLRARSTLYNEGYGDVRRRLDGMAKDIKHVAEGLRQEEYSELKLQKRQAKSAPPKRKWFKALGSVVTGAGAVVGNVAIALEAVDKVQIDQSALGGSVASVAAGVGLMLSAAGELRGE